MGKTEAELQQMIQGRQCYPVLKAELQRVQQYAVDVALDPDTAHPKLVLSDDERQVNHSGVERNVPHNPERF